MIPKISIIVPVYNVEKYLQRCVDSILNQDFQDFEVILVDDGSTDCCSEICEKYREKDDRVVVLHKENGGLSSARNAGLNIARGEYIGFVDSDDWISPTMYAELYQICDKENLEMAICGVKLCFDDEKNDNIYYKSEKNKIMSRKQALKELFLYSTFGEEAWNKLYKRCLFEKLRYPEGKIHEDTFCICEILGQCMKIGYISEVGYNYYQRENSIMGLNKKIPSVDKIESVRVVLEYLKTNYIEIYDEGLYNISSAPLKNISSVLGMKTEKALQYKKELKKFYRCYIKDIMKNKNFVLGTKIIIFSLTISSNLTKVLDKVFLGKEQNERKKTTGN